jgi:hypothetical protein
LIYLNHVEHGGETQFPRLNITVTPVANAALIFNDCARGRLCDTVGGSGEGITGKGRA